MDFWHLVCVEGATGTSSVKVSDADKHSTARGLHGKEVSVQNVNSSEVEELCAKE